VEGTRALAKVFYELGIRKVRMTGGEPLVRSGAEEYVKYLFDLGFADLSMTTTGICWRTLRGIDGGGPAQDQHQPGFAEPGKI